jgi:hypothetical protein
MDERYYLYNSIEEKRSSFSKEIINSSYYYDNNGNAAVESHESQLVGAVDVACTQSPIAGIQLGMKRYNSTLKKKKKKKEKRKVPYFSVGGWFSRVASGRIVPFFFFFFFFPLRRSAWPFDPLLLPQIHT